MAQLQCNADTCIMTYSSGDIAFNLYRSMDKFSRRQIDDIFLLFPENRIWHFMQIVSQFVSNDKT